MRGEVLSMTVVIVIVAPLATILVGYARARHGPRFDTEWRHRHA